MLLCSSCLILSHLVERINEAGCSLIALALSEPAGHIKMSKHSATYSTAGFFINMEPSNPQIRKKKEKVAPKARFEAAPSGVRTATRRRYLTFHRLWFQCSDGAEGPGPSSPAKPQKSPTERSRIIFWLTALVHTMGDLYWFSSRPCIQEVRGQDEPHSLVKWYRQ